MSFEARTFDRLPITNARFMPDGQTIVYSATPSGSSPELFVINPAAEAPQPLGLSNAHLLSVSSKGELAVIVAPRFLDQRLYGGTLARMTIGSSPRAVAEDVREADWSPDGSAMAIVHDLGNGRDRLEYPAGTVLHEASGYLSNPRVSPDGSRVAFVEHHAALRRSRLGQGRRPRREGDDADRGAVRRAGAGVDARRVDDPVLRQHRRRRRCCSRWPCRRRAPRRPGRCSACPARFIVFDVARDGRWLAVREDLSLGVRARVPGQETERDLSWIGSTGARALSADGGWLLMVDVGLRGGHNYGVVLRKTDASQAIRLGEGLPQKLSPDGKWAAAIIAPAQLVLYPTGAGDAIRVGVAPIATPHLGRMVPGRQTTARLRLGAAACRPLLRRGPCGSAPAPLTPEGVLATLAPEGRTLLLAMPDGGFELSSIDGGPTRPVHGLRSGDRQIAWSRDSQAIYVQQGFQSPATVERVALETGARSVVRQMAPEGVSAITALYVMDWVDDGRWYAYYYTSLPSTLFVVSGAIH